MIGLTDFDTGPWNYTTLYHRVGGYPMYSGETLQSVLTQYVVAAVDCTVGATGFCEWGSGRYRGKLLRLASLQRVAGVIRELNKKKKVGA